MTHRLETHDVGYFLKIRPLAERLLTFPNVEVESQRGNETCQMGIILARILSFFFFWVCVFRLFVRFPRFWHVSGLTTCGMAQSGAWQHSISGHVTVEASGSYLTIDDGLVHGLLRMQLLRKATCRVECCLAKTDSIVSLVLFAPLPHQSRFVAVCWAGDPPKAASRGMRKQGDVRRAQTRCAGSNTPRLHAREIISADQTRPDFTN